MRCRALVPVALWLAACSGADGNDPRSFTSTSDDYEWFDDEEEEDGQGGWGTPTAGAGGATADAGSKAAGGSSSGGASGKGGGGQGGNVGGSAGQGAAGGSGGSGGSAPACSYPGGGYGTSAGAVVAPSVSWNGYAPGAGTPANLSIQSFFDCDGSRGINALLLVYGAGWCDACKEEAAALPALMQSWAPAGIVIVELLVETAAGNPATTQTAAQWRDAFKLDKCYVAADPSFQLQSAVADSFPYKVLVDPRTMAIVSTYTGETGDEAVLQLALKNQ
jgi:thiol-disulfide isomerase/thioredoxin